MSATPRSFARLPFVLIALASGAFAIGASQSGAGGVILEQADDLATTDDLIALSMSAYALGVVIAAPALTILFRRLDRRRILLAMMVVAVVFNGLTALVPNVSLLIVVRFFSAIPHGVFLAAGSVVGARVMGERRRGRAMAIMMAGYTVAIILAVPLMKWMSANYGWRWAYGGVALASAVALVLVFVSVPSIRPENPPRGLIELRRLRSRNVVAATAFTVVGFSAFAVVFTFIVPILEKVDLLGVNTVSLVLSVNGIAMTIATLAAGRVTDSSPVLSARIGMLGGLAAFLLLGLWGGVPAVGVGTIVLIGAAAAFVSQGAQTHFMDVVHASPMLGAAMSHASLNAANALGAAAAAAVVGAGLGYLATAWVSVAFGLAGLVVLSRLVRSQASGSQETPRGCGTLVP